MTTSNKVNFESLVSAIVRTTNVMDTDRSFNIVADVTIDGSIISNIQNGIVKSLETETEVATFNYWSETQLSVTYTTDGDIDEKISVLRAIDTFIKDVRERVANNENLVTI